MRLIRGRASTAFVKDFSAKTGKVGGAPAAWRRLRLRTCASGTPSLPVELSPSRRYPAVPRQRNGPIAPIVVSDPSDLAVYRQNGDSRHEPKPAIFAPESS